MKMSRNSGAVPKTLTSNAWTTSPRRLALPASPNTCFHSTCCPQLSGGPGKPGCNDGKASVLCVYVEGVLCSVGSEPCRPWPWALVLHLGGEQPLGF